jgi:hypothetical protein
MDDSKKHTNPIKPGLINRMSFLYLIIHYFHHQSITPPNFGLWIVQKKLQHNPIRWDILP